MSIKNGKMKVLLALACAAALCFALAGCGGGGNQSSEPAEEPAATETATDQGASEASAAAADEVNPEFKAACDQIVSIADEMNKAVDEAIAAGDPASANDKVQELSAQATELLNGLQENQDSWTDADKAYYMDVIVGQALTDMSDAAQKLMDSI